MRLDPMRLNPMRARLPGLLAGLLLVLAAPLAGCDEAVTSPEDIEAYYTLWGALDPAGDRQALRVVPIRPTIVEDEPAPLDATVTSTDVRTGETVTWRDSLVTFFDGSTGHVFLADFRAEYARTYRVEVARADGKTTAADVLMPPLVEPIRQPGQTAPGEAFLPVLWPAAPQLNAIEVTYLLEDGDCNRFPFTLAFEGLAEPFEFGWLTTVELGEDADRVHAAHPGRPLAVVEMTLSAEVASEDWRPPGGVFDPEVLIEPGVFTNVERGFGFVGGAYRAGTTWTPTSAELTRVGFEVSGFGGQCRVGGGL
jgi:hypothetical protein